MWMKFLSRLGATPGGMRWMFNIWPPFRGSGIRVREIGGDFRSATIELRMELMNRNYVGTHFGGSLFAMTDPFFMVLMLKNLGNDYIVWDKQGTVRFLKPAKGTVIAKIVLTQESIDDAKANTASGDKYEPAFKVDIVDRDGVTVADVEKVLYIRRKKDRP
jgi:acyl-coenzyme A thioesterase PaaI-like protein